ncbi:MAG TPA: ABC transporter permease subunit [Stellaceae bacterium]|jgi:NitT/TauT family transport system permease protein|nr:ABC transporter permease subunit [Stellaceae bacterium]
MQQRWGLPIVAWPSRLRPSYWDGIALPLVLGAIVLIAWASRQMSVPYHPGEALPISLDPRDLPQYGLRTVLRMVAALIASLVFSLAYAAIAAKSKRAEKLLIPILDILQSVPILGFLSITVTGFIALFPGSLLGYECAAIFAIFTSQAWNMTFSLYQSFIAVPHDLREAARMYHLSPWQSFWQLEVPFAMPQLIWNMMMSVSGGWFFVVASEAISVADHQVLLPGIGSYISLAIDQRDLSAVLYAILAMLVLILLYDQLLFRPLLAWAQRFKLEELGEDEVEPPWFLIMMQRAQVMRLLTGSVDAGASLLSRATRRLPRPTLRRQSAPRHSALLDMLWNGFLLLVALFALYKIALFVHAEVTLGEVLHVVFLGFLTLIRVMVLILLASIVWVPIGVWIGLRPRVAHRVQPIIQFLAAFPANLFFPIVVSAIVVLKLNPQIWLSPLMILGTQWYILFNVIAGTLALPTDYQYVAGNFGVRNWLWWRRLILPAIFPAYVTGAVTASGGSWNASIVAEIAKWGDTTLQATGIGAYIADMTAKGDFPRIALGITVLSLYVLLINRLLWRRLYNLAEERLRLD